MKNSDLIRKMRGIIEVDETYVGGRIRGKKAGKLLIKLFVVGH